MTLCGLIACRFFSSDFFQLKGALSVRPHMPFMVIQATAVHLFLSMISHCLSEVIQSSLANVNKKAADLLLKSQIVQEASVLVFMHYSCL